jgi:hypothetical protein
MKKYCKYCEKDIHEKHFYKNKNTKDGLAAYCKKHSNGTQRSIEDDLRHYSNYFSHSCHFKL